MGRRKIAKGDKLTGRVLSRGASDMTEGVIWKQLLQFSVPMAVGLLFQQLYNTVDAVVVGNFVGKEALAAGSTLLGHLLFTVALGRVSATVVSFALLGEPVGAMLWSMVMFGEIPTPLLLLGGAVVLAGLGLYSWGSLQRSPAK